MNHRQILGEVRVAGSWDRLVVMPDNQQRHDELVRTLRSGPTAGLLKYAAGHLTASPPQARVLRLLADDLPLRWTDVAVRWTENRTRATSLRPTFEAALARLKAGGRAEAEAELDSVLDLDVLDDHQVLNVAAMTHPACVGLAVFDEQGAGKTVTGIYAVDVLAARDEVDMALVVAPKSMVGEWPNDVARFRGELYGAQALVGSRAQRWRILTRPPEFVVANFETVVTMEAELTALARRLEGRCVLIVDESFYVKNPDAERTRALRRLREWFGRAYVLCGTPAPNSAADLVGQFDLADFGTTFHGLQLPSEREAAHDSVKQLLDERGLYLRSLKRDVLPDLPKRTFHIVHVELAPQQRHGYEIARENLRADLSTVDDAAFRRQITSFAARRASLLQLCSNPAGVLTGYNETPAKIVALDQLLADLIGRQGEKIALWSFFTASLEAISNRYAHYGVVRYDGTVPDVAVRREAVRAFQEDAGTRLFVGNPAAAGAGLTLHAARYAIYESMSNQAAHYLQSLDRIHRRGQTREVHYIILLATDTLEEQAYAKLRDKEAAAQELLGDIVDPPLTRERMLAELLPTHGSGAENGRTRT